MAVRFERAVVLGASGPTGKFLARELVTRGVPVRVVSRSERNLARAFASLGVERVAADLLDPDATQRAVDGCDAVFDCIGLPMDRMADHPRSARNVAAAVNKNNARCVYVTGYWEYIPIQRCPLTEHHPRVNGNSIVRMRREAEDILLDAGAAVINLPDFHGPEVHAATLQQALVEAVAGKTVNWIGMSDTPREYAYIPDAMKAVPELAFHEQAYGESWIVPGAGVITLNRVLDIASQHLGRPIKARAAGLQMLRLASLFSSQLRAFMPMIPTYVQPISYDGTKLRRLLGDLRVTPYETTIPATLDWLAEHATQSVRVTQ